MNKKILIFGIAAMCSLLASAWARGITVPVGPTTAERDRAVPELSSGPSSSSADWLYNETTFEADAPDPKEGAQGDGAESTGTGSSGVEPICKGILNGSRWCDNSDGTVTDMTTGLVWLQNANCWGLMTWLTSITKPITDLRGGTCGLTDDSELGDWHLPTLDELYTLAYGPEAVAVATPYAFSGVKSDYYWSSTTHAHHSTHAWYVYFTNGSVNYYSKMEHNYVWPVRSGQ